MADSALNTTFLVFHCHLAHQHGQLTPFTQPSAFTPTLNGADRTAPDLRKNNLNATLETDVLKIVLSRVQNGTEDGMLQLRC